MKKTLILLSSLFLLTSLSSCVTKKKPIEGVNTINIVTINDMHGALFEENGHSGLSTFKADIDAIENEDTVKNTIVVGNGDMFQGGALSNITHGLATINAMNAVGFDILGIGNHEFDWGIEEITQYFDGDASNGESSAKLINSNIYKDNNVLQHSLPYSVIDLGFIKVGFVSYAPKSLTSSILQTRTDGYEFRDIKTMAPIIEEVKEKADVVVANTHSGSDVDSSINNTLKLYGADAIINGHEHDSYTGYLDNGALPGIPVVQCRDQFKDSFGLIRIDVKDKQIIKTSVEHVKLGSKGQNNLNKEVVEVLDKEYAPYKEKIEEELAVATGYQSKTLYAQWASNIIRQNLHIDVGLINMGGIRNVNIREGDTIKYGNIFDIMPFDNEVYIYTLTGEEIKSLNYEGVYSTKFSDNSLFYLEDSKDYKIGIIDYVACKFPSLRDMYHKGECEVHNVILRDMMVNELREHGKQNIKFNPKNDILLK